MKGKPFYVYALCRPNGEAFYIGKGKGLRIKRHAVEARSGNQSSKCDIIREIWAAGRQMVTKILFRTDDEVEAFQEEIRQIAVIGKATLVNRTNGGGDSCILTDEEDIARTLCTCSFCTPETAAFLASQRGR